VTGRVVVEGRISVNRAPTGLSRSRYRGGEGQCAAATISLPRAADAAASGISVKLWRFYRVEGLKCSQGRGRLLQQGLNDNVGHPGGLHVQRIRRTRRKVDYPSARVWAAIIDFDDDRAAVVEVHHLGERGQRQRALRRCGGDGVKGLTARGLAANEVIPGSFAELGPLNCIRRAATGVCATVAYLYCGLETRAP
jgi:hypothetical protein